jgi:hypothetical protein
MAKTKKKYVDNTKETHKIWNLYYPNNKIIKGDGYIIHHKDGNNFNNIISNLEKITPSKHTSIHIKQGDLGFRKGNKIWLGRKHSKESKIKIGKSSKNRICSDETKKKISLAVSGKKNGFYGKNHTEEMKTYMSNSKKGKNIGKDNPNYGNKWTEKQKREASKRTKERFKNKKETNIC